MIFCKGGKYANKERFDFNEKKEEWHQNLLESVSRWHCGIRL